ncbi:hypothetical protein EMIHUDRAFT_198910 [Emiliania huxleyi CCMP1516]|uniref:EF-hand domain-containing protein n=2 Tax=Emiliania huxleyi TaxID=2903 RepID=A0A0D3I1Z7_EMIH1|nr:hypothetical protein EMIHUDRAFT_198910 [Emiliania huxleyi CCMP1516]EOD05282.1 hypothetical protein EMIHUDRAFT_198910 [Emiliania huxleyi CCMP1516]|eukprot:XP_005757711.1 hypothetical protein EMIHUDRAFT_198910 [Emiliania huxleyi CCMP1516]
MPLAQQIEMLQGADEAMQLATMHQIGSLLDEALTPPAAGDDAEVLCEALREAGLIERLVPILSLDGQLGLQQAALLILGNMCSEEVDGHAAATKAIFKLSHGFEYLLQFLFSPDWLTVIYALGAVQNTCRDPDYWTLLRQLRVTKRLEELAHSEDAHVQRFARGTLENIDHFVDEAAERREATPRSLDAPYAPVHEALALVATSAGRCGGEASGTVATAAAVALETAAKEEAARWSAARAAGAAAADARHKRLRLLLREVAEETEARKAAEEEEEARRAAEVAAREAAREASAMRTLAQEEAMRRAALEAATAAAAKAAEEEANTCREMLPEEYQARATEAAAAQSAAAKAKAAHERTLSAFLVGDNHGAADGASDEPASPPDDPTELALDSAIKNQMAEVEAAIMLQAHARGLQGRDQLQQRRHKTSASVVQRHYRGHHGRQLARAHLARVEAETRERESRSHEQAAMRVQAAHRGRHVRQCVTGTRGRQATIESRLCEGAANMPEEHAALCPTGEDATSLSPQELEHGRAAARIAAGSRGLRDRRRLRHYRSTCPPPGQLRGDVMGSNAAAAAAASAAHERQERQALSRVACSKDGTQAEEKFPQRRGDEGRLTVARERGHGSTTRAVRSTLPSVALTSSSSEPVFSSGRLRPPAAAAKRATNAARQPSLPTVPPPRPAVPPPIQPDGLLRLALAEQVAIDGDLLASWDEDGDGSVSCADFHRSLPPLLAQWGLPRLAAMGEVIDGVFEGLGGGRVGAVPVEELRARLQDLRKDASLQAVVMGSSKPSLPCLGAHRGPTAQQRVTLYAKPAYNSTPEGSTTELQMHRAERDRRPPHRRPAPTGGGVADRRGLDRRVDPLSRFFD